MRRAWARVSRMIGLTLRPCRRSLVQLSLLASALAIAACEEVPPIDDASAPPPTDAGACPGETTFPSADTPPGDDCFYRPPPLRGRAGDVIRSRTSPFSGDLLFGAPEIGVNARQVLYQSTDALGEPMAVSGTVLIPAAA